MSRQVNLQQPLTEQDRAYLVMMGRNDLIEANERHYNRENFQQVNDGHTGDIDPFTNDDGSDVAVGAVPDEVATSIAQAVTMGQNIDEHREPTAQQDLVGLPEPSEETDNYDDTKAWSKAELAAEAEGRGLSKSGNRDEIVARLRADDASDDNDEGDEQ